MKKLFTAALLCATTLSTQAGWFATASESYLTGARNLGNGIFQCQYKTNPGNRGLQYFTVNFQGGCPNFVLYNAQNGQVTVPR